MSVIVQRENSEDKNIYLMTKGADSSMLDKMKFTDEKLNQVKGKI
jgi:magnesium-transporting ATPase (P-type)